ncbi:MAG: ATP-dependent sacrificial sulfur transferase LarE [Deltaproteobacteria bacterium]|uniref:ATP-dependent sacrificial sulfur transferase LarE n=1 Tax=Candidatus Zymogenus saltonus TaxID=2844893 RepID=A0A9D8PMX1_9DELT|nr:ATP-dependent sacrificial sulfur transferase LarE [Candidatus Zymogenus saltonus]
MKKDCFDANTGPKALTDCIKSLNRVLIAHSGGVDSTLLVNIAKSALPEGTFALSIKSPLIHDFEIEAAIREAERIGVPHYVIDFNPFEMDHIRKNLTDRCYHCKREIFRIILGAARELGIEHVLDGTNADDTDDYRPGMRALSELKIESPFLELGIGKEMIREMSRSLNIPGTERPPMACLATRFPYNDEITLEKIDGVKKAELVLMSHGFKTVRVRHLGGPPKTAKIEVGESEIERLLSPDLRDRIYSEIRRLGFSSVTVDLGGYRSGRMNEGLEGPDSDKP